MIATRVPATLSLAILAACTSLPTDASPPASLSKGAIVFNGVQTSVIEPDVYVPCANHGAGEVITFFGVFHFRHHTTISPSGNFTSAARIQSSDITGTGFWTGDRYQGSGSIQDVVIVGKVGLISSYNFSFLITGPEPEESFRLNATAHLIVNADGTFIATVDNFSATCS